ncbi:MAG: manganese-binding transcriptional regulator MntR [Erythrobacter sp.]|nr:manganese-binding transcriptional regulator MntR [Erythrobacter sp.]
MKRQSKAERRAAVFERVREANRTEIAEDYVELIDDLIAETGEARLTEVAQHMGVSHPTAAKIIQRLQRDGLVQTRPYRSIFLTEEGHQVAEESRRKHQIVLDFLLAIGVSERTAEVDSEGMEHHCSAETLATFARLTDEIGKKQGR